VVFPNNDTYHFYYDKYSELTRFVLPTGGAVEFDWDWGLHDQPWYVVGDTYRRVVERRAYPAGGNGATFETKTTFSKPEHTNPPPYYNVVSLGYVDVDHYGKVDGVVTPIARERHYYNGVAGYPEYQANLNNQPGGFSYTSYKDGKEYKLEHFDSDFTTLLRRVETTWQQATPYWWAGPGQPPLNNPHVTETITTLADVTPNLVTKRSAIDPNNPSFIGFDQYNNQTDVWEYDYGEGVPGNLLRHTHTDFVTASNYTYAMTGAHLRELPEQTIVYDPNGTPLSKTSITYDESGFPLLPYGNVTGWVDPGTNTRGNATTVSHWLNTTNTWLQNHTQYDQCGSVRKLWNAGDTTLLNPKQIEYASQYQFAYPTLTTSPDPDLTPSANGPLQPLTTSATYDFSNPAAGANGKGRLWKTETSGDSASRTTIDSYDALGRPLKRVQQFFFEGDWSAQFNVIVTYDKAGNPLTITYPSGHTVNYNYDAAGRLGDKDAQHLAFTGNLGDNINRNYSRGISYSDFGGMSEEQFGTSTAVYNKRLYTVRGQLAEMRAGRNPNDTSWELGAIINHYSSGYGCWGASCNAPDNNGNVKVQEHWIQDGNQNVLAILTQKFDYDSLNRLKRIYDGDQNQPTWQQRFIYDRWGNRTIDAGNTTSSLPHPVFTVDPATNRLNIPGGDPLAYDEAGNLTQR